MYRLNTKIITNDSHTFSYILFNLSIIIHRTTDREDLKDAIEEQLKRAELRRIEFLAARSRRLGQHNGHAHFVSYF